MKQKFIFIFFLLIPAILSALGSQDVYISKIEVILPRQNDIWYVGNTYQIKWKAIGVTHRQNISLWQGNQKITDIALSVSGGTCNWTIPISISPGNYKIKVECTAPCGGIIGESNFTVRGPTYFPDIVFISGSSRVVDKNNRYRVKVQITIKIKNNSQAQLYPFLTERGKTVCGGSGCVKVSLTSKYPNSSHPYNSPHLVDSKIVTLGPVDEDTIIFTDYFSWFHGKDNIGNYKIELDKENCVVEENENNNVAEFSLNFGKY